MRVEAVGSDGSHDEMNKNLHTGQIYKELNILYWAVEIGQRLERLCVSERQECD